VQPAVAPIVNVAARDAIPAAITALPPAPNSSTPPVRTNPFQPTPSAGTPIVNVAARDATPAAITALPPAPNPSTPPVRTNPFQPTPTAAAARPPAQNQPDPGTHIPTPEEVFGESPFVKDPRGQFFDAYSGQLRTYGFRSMYFATEAAAKKIAEQLGGTVVERSAIVGSYFTQQEPNRMILLPNGREINAGIVADFYNHGYPQSWIDRLIANEIDPTGNYTNLANPVNIVRNGVVQKRSGTISA
jgi:hypothetical protein